MAKFDWTLAKECAKAFSGAVDIGFIVSDFDGNVIEEYGYGCESCKICEIAGVNKSRCIRSQNYSMAEAERFGGKYIYYCPMGLCCFGSPILVDSNQPAKIIAGPFLMVDKDDYIDCELSGFDYKTKRKLIFEINNIPFIQTNKVNNLSTLLFMTVGFMNKVSVSNRLLETQSSENIQGQISEYIFHIKNEDAKIKYPFEIEKKLVKYILDSDREHTNITLNELLGYVLFSSGQDLNLIKIRINEILTIICRTAIDAGADSENTLSICDAGKNKVINAKNFEDMCFHISNVTNKLMDSIFKYSDTSHANTIRLCVQYINAHYYEKISLEDLAEMVYLSSAYLSRVFKKETGTTFNNYLCGVRISKAKTLLCHNDLKISDISAAVGFDDQSYFTKVFRKVVGITPMTYRAKMEKDRVKYS